MFCTVCGKPVLDEAKYCGHCGTSLSLAPADPMPGTSIIRAEQASPTNGKSTEIELPQFEEPIFLLRKARYPLPQYRSTPKLPLRWLYETVDVAFTATHLIVVSSSPSTAFKEMANTVSERLPALGLIGGPVVGLVGGALSIAVFSAGNVAERLFGQSNVLNSVALSEMVKAGVAIYATKRDLQMNLFNLKKPVLYFYNEVHVNGEFSWLDQKIDLSLKFNDEDLPDTKVKKYFSRGQCELHEYPGRMTARDSAEIRSKAYPIRVLKASLG